MKSGILTSKQILLHTGLIKKDLDKDWESVKLNSENLQPASIDLTLSNQGFGVACAMLPSHKRTVKQMLDFTSSHEITEWPYLLRPGFTIVVKLNERIIDRSNNIRFRANPKSSTGRLDLFVRLLTDNSTKYDEFDQDYIGPLYVEITSLSFPVLLSPNDELLQLRAIAGTPEPIREQLCYLNTTNYEGVNGYEALNDQDSIDNMAPISMSDRGLDCEDYFNKIDNYPTLLIKPNSFYILTTNNKISIPADQAAEMIPFQAEMGEIRVHYAGFFDPGFGMDTRSHGVLELRGRDMPFMMEHDQPVAKLIYYPMSEIPEKAYGQSGSNYQGQGLRLSKHFYPPKK